MNWADVLSLIVAILLISVVALQQSTDDISDAFSGEKSELFKNKKQRGFEFALTITTLVLSVFFVLFVILARVIR